MSKPDISVQSRLTKVLKYLQLARTSRELSYASISYVVAAEHLINEAQRLNKPSSPYYLERWTTIDRPKP